MSSNIELAQAVNQELLTLQSRVDDIANQIFENSNHEKMIAELVANYETAKFAVENEEVMHWEFESEYLNTPSKINCAYAAYYLAAAKASAVINKDFLKALSLITYASCFVGSVTEYQLALREKSDFAAEIAGKRHAENRDMKAQAIQYYKDNHKLFKSKDAAAIHISQKILHAAFATVRGWLKNVKPE